MKVLSAKPLAASHSQSRRRGRKPGKPLTPLELAARRANLVKARAAAGKGYRRTEKRLRASRANLEKAIAVRRTPEGNAAARLNALKHGLFAEQALAESVDRLGEDKEEFNLHLRLFQRVFAAGDEEEKRIVRGLAKTVWRRLRLFRAQACWEKERLQRIFAKLPAPAHLTLDDTVAHADGLAMTLLQLEAFFRELAKLESQVEFWLRKLIRKRSQGKLRWKGFSPRREPLTEPLEREEQVDQFVEYWSVLSPEEQAAVRDEVQKQVDARMPDWEETST